MQVRRYLRSPLRTRAVAARAVNVGAVRGEIDVPVAPVVNIRFLSGNLSS